MDLIRTPAVVIERPFEAAFRPVALTPKRADTVVAQTLWSAISTGTDMKTYRGEQHPEQCYYPLVPGYENMGVILEEGSYAPDLKAGDRVYVSGKLEGVLGIVTSVNYNFRIRLSEYQKVIFQVNTRVHGRFYMSASHFITFDSTALPAAQVTSWFRAPVGEGEEFASGNDDFSFPLEHLEEMKVTNAIAERGHDYFMENRVRYLCLDRTKGYAVVEGTKAYAVEFRYHDGEIQNLLCDCFCSYPCKHEFAAMLQLKETLGHIAKHYAHEYEQTGYFAAIAKETFFAFAISNCQEGGFSL